MNFYNSCYKFIPIITIMIFYPTGYKSASIIIVTNFWSALQKFKLINPFTALYSNIIINILNIFPTLCWIIEFQYYIYCTNDKHNSNELIPCKIQIQADGHFSIVKADDLEAAKSKLMNSFSTNDLKDVIMVGAIPIEFSDDVYTNVVLSIKDTIQKQKYSKILQNIFAFSS